MGRLVAETIAEALPNAGVNCCCGVLGDTLNPISRSLERVKARDRYGIVAISPRGRREARRSGSQPDDLGRLTWYVVDMDEYDANLKMLGKSIAMS